MRNINVEVKDGCCHLELGDLELSLDKEEVKKLAFLLESAAQEFQTQEEV